MKAVRTARVPQERHRLEVFLIALLFLLVFLLFVYSPRFSANPVRALFSQNATRSETTLPALSSTANLFFASADVIGLAAAEVATDAEGRNVGAAAPNVLLGQFLTKAEAQDLANAGRVIIEGEVFGHGGPSKVSGIFPSPDGTLLAIEYDFGSQPQDQILNLANRAEPKVINLTPIGWHAFLAWHPDGKSVLVATSDSVVPDPGLWLVNVDDGTHERIETPGFTSFGILAASFSPDGHNLVYAISNGMGFGSEVWRVETESKEQRQLLKDEYTTVSSLKWSPDGSQIAFVKLLDSPVAFAEAGLWLMNGDGGDARALAIMDGGHGQQPVWSREGQELYYVARENHDNLDANYVAELLVSSIRAVDTQGGEPRVLVPANGAQQLDLSLAPNGNLLFVSDRQGILDVWSVDASGILTQLTSDGTAKRHPILFDSGP